MTFYHSDMKAKELRIGNWIHLYDKLDDTPYYRKVTGFTNTGKVWLVKNPKHEECAWDIQDIKPIPLTDEWLLSLGFEKIIGGGISFNKGKISIYLNGRTDFNSLTILEESFKYVHQIQNLYFALTGYELEKIEDESK